MRWCVHVCVDVLTKELKDYQIIKPKQNFTNLHRMFELFDWVQQNPENRITKLRDKRIGKGTTKWVSNLKPLRTEKVGTLKRRRMRTKRNSLTVLLAFSKSQIYAHCSLSTILVLNSSLNSKQMNRNAFLHGRENTLRSNVVASFLSTTKRVYTLGPQIFVTNDVKAYQL